MLGNPKGAKTPIALGAIGSQVLFLQVALTFDLASLHCNYWVREIRNNWFRSLRSHLETSTFIPSRRTGMISCCPNGEVNQERSTVSSIQ